MLRAAVICPDRDLRGALMAALDNCPLSVERVVDGYPDSEDLARLMRAVSPDVVLVSGEDAARMEATVGFVHGIVPNLPFVLVDRGHSPDTLRRAMRVGIRECVGYPFPPEETQGVLARMAERCAAVPASVPRTQRLYTFLPAKPGVGASTLAVQAALALQGPIDHTLLIDCDRHAGMTRFMLRLAEGFSLGDALDRAGELDESLWPQLVTGRGSLDVLPAGDPDPQQRVELPRLQRVLDFARRHYNVICADLGGTLERHEIELMQESRRVLLVTTPEVAALHMAQVKLRHLERAGLRELVRVVVNRMDARASVGDAEIRAMLGVPVRFSVPNAYQAVQRAMMEGGRVEPSSALGQQIARIGSWMREEAEPAGYAPPRPALFRRLGPLLRASRA